MLLIFSLFSPIIRFGEKSGVLILFPAVCTIFCGAVQTAFLHLLLWALRGYRRRKLILHSGSGQTPVGLIPEEEFLPAWEVPDFQYASAKAPRHAGLSERFAGGSSSGRESGIARPPHHRSRQWNSRSGRFSLLQKSFDRADGQNVGSGHNAGYREPFRQ